MKADGLFIFMCIVFIFIAWVATGGPQKSISQAGPFITPVTAPGEESQGYKISAPANPIDSSSYPRGIGGNAYVPATSTPDAYTRTATGTN